MRYFLLMATLTIILGGAIMARDHKFIMPSTEVLKKNLTIIQYKVTQEDATEPPYQNKFWNHKGEGIYVDIVSGEPLFSSLDKYDSGCGWPSFTRPISNAVITEKEDHKLPYKRIEVRSKTADSHLGHVFNDGPKEHGGLRFCINSAALKFIPLADLEKDGYGAYRVLFEKPTANAEPNQ